MVRFSEIVLYVVIFGRDAQLDKLVLECSRLLKEAVDFAFDLHGYPRSSTVTSTQWHFPSSGMSPNKGKRMGNSPSEIASFG